MKKRFLVSLTLVALMLIFVQGIASADANGTCGANGDNLTWNLSNGVLTISGEGDMYDYKYVFDEQGNAVPDVYTQGPWLYENEDIKEVVIEEGVTSIGLRAFVECNTLETVTMADTVKNINYAFFYCENLKSITIPQNVEFIANGSFDGCNNVVISGYTGSYAESYAINQGISFLSIGSVPVSEFTVSNSEELLAAIGSNRIITMKDGIYRFDSEVLIGDNYGEATISNLTIRAEHCGEAEILSLDGFNPVLGVYYSKSITLDGIILGHESVRYEFGCGDGEFSSGYVVLGCNTNGLNIKNCDLYGCGTIGIVTTQVTNLLVENSVIRDCKECIVDLRNTSGDVEFKNCIMSGNAYDEAYAEACSGISVTSFYWNISPAKFTDCKFINNLNSTLTDNIDYTSLTNCVFSDNAWDNKTAKSCGVCLNGITWQISAETQQLMIGFPIALDDGTTIESAKGEILPYSESSMPWKNKEYNGIVLADGVTENSVNVEITSAEAKVENGKVVVSIEGTDLDKARIMAVLSDNEVLSGVSEISNNTAIVNGTGSKVRVFCWDSFDTMKPLCDVIEIEL